MIKKVKLKDHFSWDLGQNVKSSPDVEILDFVRVINKAE